MTEISEVLDDEIVRDENMEDCPVQALGQKDGNYYFISPTGELRHLRWRDFSENAIISLFDSDMSWLLEKFPLEDNRARNRHKFDTTLVTQALMKACRDEGMYDDAMPVRGVGVWKGGGDLGESLIVHCGDALYQDGNILRAGKVFSGQIFPAAPKIPHLSDVSATKDDGMYIFDALAHWNFTRGALDRYLVLGFAGQAMLGGAPKWKAHMYTTAQAGAGKTWLVDLMQNLLGGAAHPSANNFTEAGLRQALTGQARCLLLDESEAEDGGGRVRAVIEMLRHMSSKGGASTVRGSAGGTAQHFNVTGCAYLSSILHVPLQPQDKQRITLVKLDPLDDDAVRESAKVEEAIRKIKQLSPSFRRRMVDMWPKFCTTYELYRGPFMDAGLSPRGADQLSVLMASKEMLISDDVPSKELIEKDIELCAPLIKDMLADVAENEGQLCLGHLLSYITDMHEGGVKHTIGQLMEKALDAGSRNSTYATALASYGVKYIPRNVGKAVPDRLLVAHQSVGLKKVFAGTRWNDGAWSQAFNYLDGVTPGGSHRFAGQVARSAEIPIELCVDRRGKQEEMI